MTKYAVVDIETGGLEVTTRPYEIAVIECDEELRVVRRTLWREVPTEHERRAMLEGPMGPWLEKNSPALRDDFAACGNLDDIVAALRGAEFVVGYNVQFDVSVLDRFLGRRVVRRCIDTVSVAWSKGYPVRSADLFALVPGFDSAFAHGAMYDAEMTLRALRMMMLT